MGVWVICAGPVPDNPPIVPAPAGDPCAGTATQCLNALDPSNPNEVPVP